MSTLKRETEVIGNVPAELVEQFKLAFPDHPDLLMSVSNGWCDGVSDTLALMDEGVLNKDQQEAVDAWWNLYHAVFQS